MFSSTMRKEAHLLLHLSQWKTWHLTNHTIGTTFAKTQESVFNAFRDDELHLSKQALRKAYDHISCNNKVFLDMAKNYASLREKTCRWWCGITYKICVEFTTQSPRNWDAFEFRQRSQWEYLMHIESAMCDFHFHECSESFSVNDMATNIHNPMPLTSATALVLRADGGHYIHHHVGCLKNYVLLSTSSRNKVFSRACLARWKAAWEEVWGTNAKRLSFLEAEKQHLDRYRCEEHALFDLHFPGPAKVGFGAGFGCSRFTRELDHYRTLRTMLWDLFCHDIVSERWTELFHTEIPNYNDFERSQTTLWEYFDIMEQAMLKVHEIRCTHLVGVGCALPLVPVAILY